MRRFFYANILMVSFGWLDVIFGWQIHQDDGEEYQNYSEPLDENDLFF